MDISDVSNGLERIALPQDQKKAIIQLIDLKINNDMEKVIAKLTQIEERLEAKIQITQDMVANVRNEIKVIYWVVGISMAIIMFMVARK
jgi:hypothetical protein